MSDGRRGRGETSRPPKGPDKVGYGRPPKQSQFPKGVSGNPGGKLKPRAAKTLPDIGGLLGAIMSERMAITIGGRKTKISLLEIMLKTLAHAAAKGDTKAVRELVKLIERFPPPPPEAARSNGPSAIDRLKRKLETIRERMQLAEEQGLKPRGGK